MRILITGINSALGSTVADSLSGHEVIGLGRRHHPKYATIIGDLRHGVPPLPASDVCLHMAFITDPKFCAENHPEAYQVNVAATASLVAAAPRFVLVSTGYVYGFQDGLLEEDMRLAPHDAYSAMKLSAEEIAARHPNAAVLRYFFPYGPLTKPGGVVNRLIAKIAAGEEIELHDSNRPRTNPIFISDMARATRVFCLEDHRGIYNVGGAEVVSIKDLAESIGKLLGRRPRFRRTGKNIKDMIGSTQKLDRLFRPVVNLANGLPLTVAHAMNSFWTKEKAA
jgi:nucleoside-diphosphate-sugar epimerase